MNDLSFLEMLPSDFVPQIFPLEGFVGPLMTSLGLAPISCPVFLVHLLALKLVVVSSTLLKLGHQADELLVSISVVCKKVDIG